MKTSIFLSILFLSCATSESIKCWVSHGLNCKVLNGDLTGASEVTFDIGELDFEDFETVGLIETKLTDVPSGIFSQFMEVKQFTLSENNLKQWKSEYLKGAVKLTYLYVTENSITSLPADSFAEAPNLEIIEISNCNLAKLAPNAFGGLKNLIELRLQTNKIGNDLRIDTFDEISQSLQKLNIAENEIEKIPENFFKKMKKLRELTIYYNAKIQEVDGNIFPESLKIIAGLIQFKIKNPPEDLEFELDDYHFGKRDEL